MLRKKQSVNSELLNLKSQTDLKNSQFKQLLEACFDTLLYDFISGTGLQSRNTRSQTGTMVSNLPRSPTASHRFGSSVTPGMGAKVADTKVARPGATAKSVLLGSTAGTGAGVGEGGGDGRDGKDVGGAAMISGPGNSGAAVTLVCGGVRGLPYWAPGPVLVKMVGEGVVVWFWEVETFPGAGAAAVFRGLIREVGILPPAGGGAVLECWVVLGCLPLNGAVGLLPELGLEVVFLLDGERAVCGVDAFGLVGGGLGWGFPFDGGLGLFPTAAAAAAADAGLVAVLVAVVVIVPAAVVVGEWTSSTSGLTTTKDVTGVTKLYVRERFVALSTSSLWVAGSVVFSLACSSSLMVK